MSILPLTKLSQFLASELKERCHFLHKNLRTGVANFVSCLLSEKSVNLSILANALPRDICENEHRYQYLIRTLKNKNLIPSQVMSSFISDLLLGASKNEEPAIIMIDQTKIIDGFECLMISLRLENRAAPLLWKVVPTGGAIGWDVLEKLLAEFVEIMPLGIKICLMADRFYGHSKLIDWCNNWGFDYRIRLKNNLIFEFDGGLITPAEVLRKGMNSIRNAKFKGTEIAINIGIIHEKGHPEPWFIAMPPSIVPSRKQTLEYGKRWGIEAMFSDFKSRGYNIEAANLQHGDRLEKLILMIAIAIITATFAGIKIRDNSKEYIKKNSAVQNHPSNMV